MSVRDHLRRRLGRRVQLFRVQKLVDRDIDAFESDQRALIRGCEEAERALEFAGPDEEDARREAYLELVELGRERLQRVCDTRVGALQDTSGRYAQEFHRSVLRRLSRFAAEIDQP